PLAALVHSSASVACPPRLGSRLPTSGLIYQVSVGTPDPLPQAANPVAESAATAPSAAMRRNRGDRTLASIDLRTITSLKRTRRWTRPPTFAAQRPPRCLLRLILSLIHNCATPRSHSVIGMT